MIRKRRKSGVDQQCLGEFRPGQEEEEEGAVKIDRSENEAIQRQRLAYEVILRGVRD